MTAIDDKHMALGGERSILGRSLLDIENWCAGGGRCHHYIGGSIYWSAQTQAHFVYGAIRDKWQELGYERGSLGYPVSDPENYSGLEIRQQFQGGKIGWTPQNGIYLIPEPKKRDLLLRVFLVDFTDVPHPSNYTTDFFNRYFFSVNQTFNDPNNIALPGSVHDYFYNVSGGHIRIKGCIDQGIRNSGWTRLSMNIGSLFHWTRTATRARGNLTIGAAVIPNVLKARGILTVRDLWVNGRRPDCLIFYTTDLVGGGGKRCINDALNELRDCYNTDHNMDTYNREWQSLDAQWRTFGDMSFISIPCTWFNPGPAIRSDGTIDAPSAAFPLSRIQFNGNGVLAHELGHVCNALDLYGSSYEWHTQSDPMSGQPWEGNFAAPYTAYNLEAMGLFNLTEMTRRSHRQLTLNPYETHRVAYRFQNGPINQPETLTIENRKIQDLRRNPPVDIGRGLLAYRIDPKRRQAISVPGEDHSGNRRIGFMIGRPGQDWGEYWGYGGNRDLTGQGRLLENTLNHLGELWWEFRNINIMQDGTIQFDAEFKPLDLIQMYANSTSVVWTNSRGEELKPNVFQEAQGHVILMNQTEPVDEGLKYNHVLFLHPDWSVNGKVRGRYRLQIPAGGARLYLTIALSEQASGSTGFNFRVIAHEGSGTLLIDRVLAEERIYRERNKRTFVVDLSAYDGTTIDITLEVDALANATRDWAYLLEGYLVPMSPIQFDFVARASSAQWSSNIGAVNFGTNGQVQGLANHYTCITLQNGFVYGGKALVNHPSYRRDGYIEGVYQVILSNNRSIFRAEVGFEERRTITHNGTRISARFVEGNVTYPILNSTLLSRLPRLGEVGTYQNTLTSIAIPIPDNLAGHRGQFILKVDADGESAQDFVVWTMAKLTEN